MKIRIFLILCILSASASAWAQSTDTAPEGGEKPLGTYFATDIDTVSLTNGNLHVHIPVFSLPRDAKCRCRLGSITTVNRTNGVLAM